MDLQELSTLLTDSTKHLEKLHAQLGHSPDHLQTALDSLHKTLKNAVDSEVAKVAKDVDDARKKVEDLNGECDQLQVALGEGNRENSRETRRGSGKSNVENAHNEELPLLPQITSLQSEAQRLRGLYATRTAQVDKARAQLDAYRPILGSYVPPIECAMGGNDGRSSQFMPLPISYINNLNSALNSCASELQKRRTELTEDIQTIVQLWSELCVHPEIEPQADCTLTFDSKILRHLRLKPVLSELEPVDEDGNAVPQGNEKLLEFRGEFVLSETAADEDTNMAAEASSSTPTKTSGAHVALGPAPRLIEVNELSPQANTLALLRAKRQHLEGEKIRREERIQGLYDELVELWLKFDVGEEEMDAFVQGNSGSTLAVVEVYESELLKMRELKSQHMALFISKVRERIAEFWDEIRTSPEERKEDFIEFFSDLDDGSGEVEGGVEPSDELLQLHEERVNILRREAELKRGLLQLVKRYRDLCDEGRALEESAKDQSRLMGRGARGDPGRLLREEKTRKRIKTLKPKLEEELQKAIPVWESETGKVFTVDGVRLLDELQAVLGDATSRKRARVASNPSKPILGASDAQNRPTTAATPQTGNKRQRVNSAMNSVQSNSSRLNSSVSSTGGNVHGSSRMQSGSARPVSRQQPSANRFGAPGSASTQSRANMNRNQSSVSPTKGSATSFGFAGQGARVQQSMPYKAPTAFRPRPSALSGSKQSSPAGQTHRFPASIAGQRSHLPHQQLPSHGSNNSISSMDTNATTVIHPFPKPQSKLQRRGPSIAVESSLSTMQKTSSRSAYARPSVSGAGATIRTISADQGKDGPMEIGEISNGPNWAVLDEGEEEDDLMTSGLGEAHGGDFAEEDLLSMRGENAIYA